MARFKVGDRARAIGDGLYPGFRGAECTVIEIGPVVTTDHKGDVGSNDYVVDFGNGIMVGADKENLEKIIETGSWEAIESATGWKPGKERERA